MSRVFELCEEPVTKVSVELLAGDDFRVTFNQALFAAVVGEHNGLTQPHIIPVLLRLPHGGGPSLAIANAVTSFMRVTSRSGTQEFTVSTSRGGVITPVSVKTCEPSPKTIIEFEVDRTMLETLEVSPAIVMEAFKDIADSWDGAIACARFDDELNVFTFT